MHHAVELILKRMESHPEDFVQGRSGQWLQIINAYKKFFNEEEGIAIREALRKINMDSMTEDIMKRMVKDEEHKAIEMGWENIPAVPSKIIASQNLLKSVNALFEEQYEKYSEEHKDEWAEMEYDGSRIAE